MKNLLQISFFFALAGVCILSTACKKEEDELSKVPHIEFKSAVLTEDSSGSRVLKLTLGYLDGDGDIGLKQEDTSGVFAASSPYYFNLVANYYEKINGEFTQLTPKYPFPLGDTIRFNGRIPDITPTGLHRSVRGDIEYTLDLGAAPVKSDTVKFEFYLFDRSLNRSNAAESPEIVI